MRFDNKATLTTLAAAVAGLFCGGFALANPVAPQVAWGQAGFVQQGNTLTVTNTPGTVINWQSFSIGSGELTRFVQQNAASTVLNRVVGPDSSQILGRLQSNGQVYLINPNGILFGGGSQVDVAGLVASSLQISDQDFLAGKGRFSASPGAAAVANAGTLRAAAGGRIFLLAPNVANSGLIEAPGGQILLAAGQQVNLVDADNPELQVVVSAPGDQAVNLGSLVAESGRIGIFGALLRQAGTISADGAVYGDGGRIFLKAGEQALIEAGSTTSASGAGGGAIVVDAAGDALVGGRLAAAGSAGKGGEVQVLGRRVAVTAGGQVDVSGSAGGGSILLGGDTRGENPLIRNAEQTRLDRGASLAADALVAGDGGKVVVWGNQSAQANGSISARGGAQGGDGGFVETSGRMLDTNGLAVDTRAPLGRTGLWLLDPIDIVIGNLSNDANGGFTGGSWGTTLSSGTSNICVGGGASCGSGLIEQLATTSVNVSASGTLTVQEPISWSSGNSLTLLASGGDLAINANITSTGSSAGFSASTSGIGQVRINGSGTVINVGGPLSLSGYAGVVAQGQLQSGQKITISGNVGAVQLDKPVLAGINLDISGTGISATSNLQLEAQAGVLTLGAPTTVTGKASLSAGSISIDYPLTATAVSLTTDALNISTASAYVRATGTTTTDGIALKTLSPGKALTVSSSGGAGLVIDPGRLVSNAAPAFGQISSQNFYLKANAAPVNLLSDLILGTNGLLGVEGSGISQSGIVNAKEINFISNGANIGLSNVVNAGSKINLQTTTSGSINQTAASSLLAPQLSITAAGDVNLNLGSNQVSQLTASTGGDFLYNNLVDLATNGIKSTKPAGGTISLNMAGGNLTVNAPGIDVCSGSTTGCSGSISLVANQAATGSQNIGVNLLRAGTVDLQASGNVNDLDGALNNVVHPSGGTVALTYSVGGSISLDAWGASVSGSPPMPAPNVDIRTSQPVVAPTLSQCIADPTLSGCSKVLPSLSTCISAPSTQGCSVVLPSLSQCIAAPTTAGCTVVLPSLATCIAAPSTSGCSVVLPSLSQCIAAPTTEGCTVVLPSLATCIAAPSTSGCSVVLPSLSQCVAAPTTAGCTVVLPSLATCIAAPSTSGCSVVLPSLSQCVAAPTTAGCTVVLPSLASCIAAPSTAGCSVVLPALSQCEASPSLEGCSVVLPALDTCVATPTTPGCTVVLPPPDNCLATPTLPGCTAVLPAPLLVASEPAVNGVLEEAVLSCNTLADNLASAGVAPQTGSRESGRRASSTPQNTVTPGGRADAQAPFCN